MTTALLIISSLTLIASLLVLAGAAAIGVALKKSLTQPWPPTASTADKPPSEAPTSGLRVVKGGDPS